VWRQSVRLIKILTLIQLAQLVQVTRADALLKKLEGYSTYTEFAELLKSTKNGHVEYLLQNYVTVFAPSNEALQAFKKTKDVNYNYNNFVLNHIASEPPKESLQSLSPVSTVVGEDSVGQTLTTVLQGHPNLWIRKNSDGLFVNNAKVKLTLPLYNPRQILYLIDRVIEPLVPTEGRPEDFVDIKAGDVLKKNIYDLGNFSISRYAKKVKDIGFKRFPDLNKYSQSTFFIPVDSAFDDMLPNVITEEVIRSHIVPGNLMFSRPIAGSSNTAEPSHSAQWGHPRSPMKVSVTMYTEADGSVKAASQTVIGTSHYTRGRVVVATVVKANIPVRNGIVHLVDRPFVVMASTLMDTINSQANSRFSMFADYLKTAPDLIAKIESTKEATLFIPSNEAFAQLNTDPMQARMAERAEEILGLHFLDGDTIASDDIRIHKPVADSGMFSLNVNFPEGSKDRIWFWVNKTEEQKAAETECEKSKEEDDAECSLEGDVFVDGGGTMAEIVEKDIGASNGVIQVLNKMLGIPMETDTIKEKLRTDPMMTDTNTLGKQADFNDELGADLNFTYFVPSDKAWEQARGEFPSAIHVLFMGPFSYQTSHLLQRHLKIGAKLTMEEMEEMKVVEMRRGGTFRVETKMVDGKKVTMIEHNDRRATIVRPNVECTNGYIHVIDSVMMKRRDVTLAGGSYGMFPSLVAVCSTYFLTFLLH